MNDMQAEEHGALERNVNLPMRRLPRADPSPHQWAAGMFSERRGGIDAASVAPEFLAELERDAPIQVEGAEHLSGKGPMIVAASHAAVPLVVADNCIVSENVFVTLSLFTRLAGRPLWCFADLSFYEAKDVLARCAGTYDRLGFFPGTAENAMELLRMGESVGIWPEGRTSRPGYRLRPFFWGFARCALRAGIPVVPLILLGPHERHLVIERGSRPIILNRDRPFSADYRMIVLPAMAPQEFASGEGDTQGLARFCEAVRECMQERIERECVTRPLARLARQLDEAFSESSSMAEGQLVPPDSFFAAHVDTLPPSLGITRDAFGDLLRWAFFQRLMDQAHQQFRQGSGFTTYGLWDAGARNVAEAGERLIERLLENIPIRNGRVLDLQCGSGASTNRIAQRLPDAEVIGTDRIGDHKQDWLKFEGRCKFAQMEPGHLRFPDASFDVVVCLEGGFRAFTREAMLAEAVRVLKPGGSLLLSDVLHDAESVKDKLKGWLARLFEANHLDGPAGYTELLERLECKDIVVEDVHDSSIKPYLEQYTKFLWNALLSKKLEAQAGKALAQREIVTCKGISHYVLVKAHKAGQAMPAAIAGADAGAVATAADAASPAGERAPAGAGAPNASAAQAVADTVKRPARTKLQSGAHRPNAENKPGAKKTGAATKRKKK